MKSTYPESCREWEQSLSGCLQSQPEPAAAFSLFLLTFVFLCILGALKSLSEQN